MVERILALAVGSLLHDFGKLLHGNGEKGDHSTSGYEYLKEQPLLKDRKDILDCIRYHHASALRSADISDDAICYITYIADDIAFGTDACAKETSDGGFVRNIPAETVFNILNGNNDDMVYRPDIIDVKSEIAYPTYNSDSVTYSEEIYSTVIKDITDLLKEKDLTKDKLNSLLLILEDRKSVV